MMDASVDAMADDASPDPMMDAAVDAPPPYNGPIGAACETDSDCGAGNRCQPTVPSGYCVADCNPDKKCPEGTLCSPLPMSRVSGVCMRACATSAECRAGYKCEVVELFPGDPNTPKSPGTVCWEPQ